MKTVNIYLEIKNIWKLTLITFYFCCLCYAFMDSFQILQ